MHQYCKQTLSFLLLLCLLCPFPGSAQEAEALGSFSFEGIFLEQDEPVITRDTEYISQNVAVFITKDRVNESDVTIAEIYLKNLSSYQRVFWGGAWKKNPTQKKVSALAEQAGAVLAITGDNSFTIEKGPVLANGTLYRSTSNRMRDVCILYRNGEMKTLIVGKDMSADNIVKLFKQETASMWQCFLFGPALLDSEGKAMTSFNTKVGPANPRSVIGYYEPGHYAFIQVDGRGTASALEPGAKNKGMTMKQLSAYMESLQLKCAYNLDGGQSSMLYFGGKIVSTPAGGGRNIADVVAVLEP